MTPTMTWTDRVAAVDWDGVKTYTLTGRDGQPYRSAAPGAWGGHRATKIYGRLDCPAALRAIARGGYVRQRVFFVDEQTAIAAGYRPCAACCPDRYRAWRSRGQGEYGPSATIAAPNSTDGYAGTRHRSG